MIRIVRKYRPDEVSRLLAISIATVYRLIKRLGDSQGECVEKDEAGRVCLTERGLEKVREMAGVSPCESNENQSGILSMLRETIENQTRIIENHLENVRKKDEMITALIASQAEERKRADTIIMTLTKQLVDQAKQIEEMKKSPALLTDDHPKIVPIPTAAPKATARPTPPPPPAEPETIGQRLAREVLEMFQPWRKRAEWKAEHRKAA